MQQSFHNHKAMLTNQSARVQNHPNHLNHKLIGHITEDDIMNLHNVRRVIFPNYIDPTKEAEKKANQIEVIRSIYLN